MSTSVERTLLSLAGVPVRFVDQGLVSTGSFVVAVLAAHALGPAKFGVFALLWTVNALAISAQWAFIVSPMQSTLPRTAPAERFDLCFALLAHSIAIAGIAAVLAVIIWISATAERIDVASISIVAVSFGIAIVQDYVRRWRLASDHAASALAGDFIRYGGSLAGILWAWGRGLGLVWIIAVIGIASLAACIPFHSQYRNHRWKWRSVIHYAKAHAQSGRVLVPFVGVQTGIAAAPIYVLSAFVNTATAGAYRAAVSLISPIITITEALETFLPLRAARTSNDESSIRRLLHMWQMRILAISSLYTAILWIAGDKLETILFGPHYAQYVVLLYPLSLAALLQNLVYVRQVELRTRFRFRKILYAEVVAATALGLSYLFLPFGRVGMGVAIAAMISQAVKLIALNI